MLDNVRSWSRDGDSKRLREAQENDGAEPLLEVLGRSRTFELNYLAEQFKLKIVIQI